MANYIAKGRQVVLPLTNKAANAVEYGDVVILDTTATDAFDVTTTEDYSGSWIGVVVDQDGIAVDAVGRVCVSGYVAQVNLDGAAAIGDYLFTDSVAEQGTPNAVRGEGAFGQAMEAAAAPSAYIWGNPDGAGGGGGAPDDVDYWVETADGGLSAEVVVGTTGITTATYATRQAAAKAGRLFLPSDGVYLERDTGAAWSSWGPIFPFTRPVLGDFTWVNQGTATVTDTYGGIYLYAAAAVGANHKVRIRAIPGANYTVKLAFMPQMHLANNNRCGFVWRENSTGKEVAISYVVASGVLTIIGEDFSGPTTYVANNFGPIQPIQFNFPVFWKIVVDGTNRNLYWSVDGQNYLLLWQEGKTTYITPDEIGFFVSSENGTYPVGMTLLSWEQS